MAGQSEFLRSMRFNVKRSMVLEAQKAATDANAAGDLVAAMHHEARANTLDDSWNDPEVEQEVITQLRGSLDHPDPDVRESARQGLEQCGVYTR